MVGIPLRERKPRYRGLGRGCPQGGKNGNVPWPDDDGECGPGFCTWGPPKPSQNSRPPQPDLKFPGKRRGFSRAEDGPFNTPKLILPSRPQTPLSMSRKGLGVFHQRPPFVYKLTPNPPPGPLPSAAVIPGALYLPPAPSAPGLRKYPPGPSLPQPTRLKFGKPGRK